MLKKIVVLSLVLLSAMAVNLWAQLVDLPGGNFSSPQGTATQGRIRSMADDMLRPDAYRNVKFDKWYGIVSFSNLFDAKAMLGAATNIGKVYFSPFYRGSFWENMPNTNYTRQGLQFQGGDKTFPVYDSLFNMQDTHPNNTLGVLVGFADMGLRFSFNTRRRTFSETDIGVGSPNPNIYKSYDMSTGNIHPQLVWSMAKDLTKNNGVRPYASVDLIFSNYYEKFDQYDPLTGTTKGQEVETSMNYFEPRLTLGLGTTTLYRKNEFSLSTDLEYQMHLRVFNNEYHYNDGTVNKIETIRGLNTSKRLTEDFYIYNSIMPSLAGSWRRNGLALRFQLRVTAGLTNEEAVEMDGSTGSLIETGIYEKTTTFLLDPQLRLAAQWTINPKISLNFGGLVRALPMIVTSIDEENSASRSIVFTGAQTELGLGFTFNPTDNLSFEAMCGIDPVNNSINVFNTGNGLFIFVNILASLKF